MVRLGEPADIYNEGFRGGIGSKSAFGFPSGGSSIPQRAASIRSLSSAVTPQAGPSSSPPTRPGGHHVSSSSSTTAAAPAVPTGGVKSQSGNPSSPQQLLPRTAYQLRDITSTATPYCQAGGPVETIAGEFGLVRATLLNDRVHGQFLAFP